MISGRTQARKWMKIRKKWMESTINISEIKRNMREYVKSHFKTAKSRTAKDISKFQDTCNISKWNQDLSIFKYIMNNEIES